MTDREKLIEILRVPIYPHEPADPAEVVADYLLDNGMTVQRWIPVTERLPTREDANPNESVLAITKDDGFGRSWIWDIVVRYPQEFTHWMSFPEPPKGEWT